MASAAQLQQHLDRLRVPHAGVQQATVAAAFDALAKAPGLSAATRDAAIAACLSSPHKAAVEAAVTALQQLPPAAAPTPAEQHDLLLTALAVAGPGTAAPLAAGILQLFERQLGSDSSGGGTPSQAASTYRSRPLSKALLSNAAAAQPLVLGAARLLARAAAADGGGGPTGRPAALHRALPALRPFLSFALLDPQLQGAQPLLAPQLYGTLARVACCATDPPAQVALLGLLVAHLPALRVGAGAQQQEAAVAALGEVLDVVEACSEDPGGALPLAREPRIAWRGVSCPV